MDSVLPQTEATFTNVDLIVLSPGVPIDIAPVRRLVRRASRSSVKSNWRATFFTARSAALPDRTARRPQPP